MKTPHLDRKTINIVSIAITSPVLLILLVAGAAKAYDTYLINSLESSLKANVEAMKATSKACEESYQSLLRYKQDAKLKIEGTGSPCFLPATE